jgi:hypothetical protein
VFKTDTGVSPWSPSLAWMGDPLLRRMELPVHVQDGKKSAGRSKRACLARDLFSEPAAGFTLAH